MSYPFRFYGHGATDWYEGANSGHSFSVGFERRPTKAEMESLGATFERMLATGVAHPSTDRWMWSGRFATFRVGERWPSAGGHIGAVANFLFAAHRIVPIVDVIYVNARAHGRGWDAWSRRSPPDPGPDEKRSDLVLRRPVDPKLPAMAPVEAFEDARQRAVDELAAAKADAVAEVRKPGKVGLARLPDVELEYPEVVWPKDVQEKFAKGEALASWIPERPIAIAGDRFAWLDADGRRREPAGDPSLKLGRPALSPDGEEALCTNGEVAHHVDLRTGAVTEVHRRVERDDGSHIRAAEWLDAGDGELRWAVFSYERILVFAPGAPPTLVVEDRARRTVGIVARRGRVIFASNYGKDPRVMLFHGDKLHAVGGFKAKFEHSVEVDDRIILYAGRAKYEVTHVDELLAARVAKAKPKKRAKEVAPQTVSTAAPDEASAEERERLGVGAKDQIRIDLEGRLFGIRRNEFERICEVRVERGKEIASFPYELGATSADAAGDRLLLGVGTDLIETGLDLEADGGGIYIPSSFSSKDSLLDVLALARDHVLVATVSQLILLGPGTGSSRKRKKLHALALPATRSLVPLRSLNGFLVVSGAPGTPAAFVGVRAGKLKIAAEFEGRYERAVVRDGKAWLVAGDRATGLTDLADAAKKAKLDPA